MNRSLNTVFHYLLRMGDAAASLFRRRQRFIAALTANERRFKDYAACSADIFWETDAEDHFTYISGELAGQPVDAMRLIGKSREMLSRLAGIDVENDLQFQKYRRLLALREPYRGFEYRIRRPLGAALCLSVSAIPIFDGAGNFVGYRGTSRDITETVCAGEALQHAKEEAEAATRARTEYLETMSHEIRNPLNGVIGLSRMLSDVSQSTEGQALATALQESAEHLRQLIDEILDLSRIESGHIVIEETPFDLHRALQTVLAVLRPEAEARKLALSYAIAAVVPQHVIGDAGRLRQVLLNLAGNALKFTEQGSVALEVALSRDSAADEAGLVITVRDTGVGIAPEAMAKLFTRFSQGNATIARHYGGSGLGLAISRELVELMGGDIRVTSELGQGSVFRFTVRLRRAADVPALELPQTVECAPTAGRAIRVLLAEDDRVNQLVALDMLHKMGCSVEVVGDGRAAVEAAATKDYDIVLLDALMPEIDGLQATRMIRSLPRPYSEIPIIAMTGRASVEDRAVCLAAGADEFIAKPVSPEQLAAAFATLLRTGQPGVDDDMVPADFGEAAPVLIAIFTAETEARFRRMRGLCRAEDRLVLQREAHSLKSVAATFGCRRLADMAAVLESDATSDRFDVAHAVDDMALEFERMRKRINREIAERREAA